MRRSYRRPPWRCSTRCSSSLSFLNTDTLIKVGAPQVPAASLALFNTLSIIILIPIYDRGLVPLLRHFGTKLTLLSRIGEPTPLRQPPIRRGMCWVQSGFYAIAR